MAKSYRTKFTLFTLIASILFTIGLPIYNSTTYADPVSMETIRAALFINVRGTVPAVTLSSGAGLSIGNRLPSGDAEWMSVAQGQPVRFSVDQYSVRVAETPDFAAAATLYRVLRDESLQPFIYQDKTGSGMLYRVYAGNYGTSDEAAIFKDRIANTPSVKVVIGNKPVDVAGPLHLSAGTFAAEADALTRLEVLQQKGIVSFIVYSVVDGKKSYSVWAGEAASEAGLAAVQADIQKQVPGLSLARADASDAYLLKRNDVSLSANSGTQPSAINHYAFSAAGQKIIVTAPEPGIRVQERGDRTYRGAMELTRYESKLALINEVSFEQYLYSVVGSELDSSFPAEALKSQAVAARTYALAQGMKYKIAHISDTTFDQAYYGMGREFAAAIAAVDATRGEVLVDKNGFITPFYYSNSGGLTADYSEIWGNPIDYVKSVPSPDEDAQKGKLLWHRIALSNGSAGYIRSDLVRNTGTRNAAGLPIYEPTGTGINVRPAPYVPSGSDNAPIAQVNPEDRFVSFEQTIESNAFSWIRGPFTAAELLRSINLRLNDPIRGSLLTLEVMEQGPSKRVTKMSANGRELPVSYPDAYRSMLNGLPSTRFEVEETGRYTIRSASDTRTLPETNGTLYAISASGGAARAMESTSMFFMNADGDVRLATKEPMFRFVGYGFGHGLGMSQWGARAWAELGYDYKYILQYYFHGVSIVKG